MTRRVVLGKQADGSYGLRVSLPGTDAYTGDGNDTTKFSFNSQWTDIARIHQIGVALIPFNNGLTSVAFPDLGYRPFIEVRQIVGATLYDDWFSTSRSGIGSRIDTNTITTQNLFGFDFVIFYMIFRIPVPTQ